jgi:hypothetical protein
MNVKAKPTDLDAIGRRLANDVLREIGADLAIRDAATARINRHLSTFRLAMEQLSSDEKAIFNRRLEETMAGIPAERKGGESYGQVIELFRAQRELTVPQIFQALKERGKNFDSKGIYNAVGYLEKVGRIFRVARGKYVLRTWGVGFETEEEFGGADGSPRITEHDV